MFDFIFDYCFDLFDFLPGDPWRIMICCRQEMGFYYAPVDAWLGSCSQHFLPFIWFDNNPVVVEIFFFIFFCRGVGEILV